MSSASLTQLARKLCSQCGSSFGCGAYSTTSDCWCKELPNVGPVAALGQDCLCPDCLTSAISQKQVQQNEDAKTPTAAPSAAPLIEGEDYYLEGPAMVFTAHFLQRRGYCCENGCRHCPYGEG